MRMLLPCHEITESLEGDLEEGFARRAAESPLRAKWWYLRQVMTLPYAGLNREIGRLRASGDGARAWRGGGWMNGITMDLRVAARSLARRPAFTGVALATLALSVGAATLLFSVVDGVLLSPLPYERPEELVTVYLTNDEWRSGDNELLRAAWDVQTMTLRHAEAFREVPGPIAAMAAYTYRTLPLEPRLGTVEDATVILVDREAFALLGAEPGLGRLPTMEEIRSGAPVAVLRHETWRRRFGGDPDVLGSSFRLGDRTLTTVGIMPPGFFFPTESGGDLWAPVSGEVRDWPSFYGVARLAPEASVDEATEFFERVARGLGAEDASMSGLGGRAVPHVDSVVGSVRGGIQLLFGTALLVVLVACANLGNLFLARTASRRDELAVRVSLGAGTGSLTSTVLAEVLVIGLVGGGIGVVLAGGAIGPFVGALETSLRGLPRRSDIGLDTSVLLFSFASTLVTLLAAGFVPVLVSARRAPAVGIGSKRMGGGTSTRRGQRLLLSVQGALTVVLVLAAALLGRSFIAAASVDMGMATERVAVLEVQADRDRYPDGALRNELHEAVRARLAAVPSVSSVGLASSLPSQGGVLLQRVRPEGAEATDLASVITVTAGADYFTSMGIPVLAGRGLQERDGTDEVAGVVVSEALARQLFGRPDAVGDRLHMGSGAAPDVLRIVGVVGESRQLSVFQPPEPSLYYPMGRRAGHHFYLTIAVDGDPAAMLADAREAALSVEGNLEIERAATFRRMLHDSMRHVRLRMILMASLAALAGVLAMIGISGVVAHFLSEQTRDVGIRMALGAAAAREVGRVVRQALWPTAMGMAIGLAVALPASTVMQDFVFGIEPRDPLTYIVVTGGLLASALLAAWLPARRAAAVDPIRVLTREM
jgi:predicted permease